MIRLIEIVKKDLKEYYRESTTFKIVLFSPLIIITVFGLIFSSGVPSTINLPMKIAVCSMEENLPEGFIKNLKEEKWVQVEEIEEYKDCDKAVKDSVSAGLYKGGISIPEGFTANVINGNRSNLNIYIDNSLIGVEGILRGYLWRVIQKYSENFKEDPMTNLKNEFFNLSLQLKEIENSLSFSQPIKNFESDAEELNTNLQNIDTEEYNKNIETTNTKLENAKIQIDSTYNEIENFRKDIQLYIKELEDVKTDLINYDEMILETKNALETLYNNTCDTGFPLFPDVAEVCDQIYSSIQELEQIHQELQQRVQSIDKMINDLKQADNDLKEKQIMLLQMKKDLEDSQKSLEYASDDITYLDNMKVQTKDFFEQIDSYSENVKEEETKMKNEINTFNNNINELLIGASILPLNPIEIDVRNTFESMSFLDLVIPSLIALLAMFTPLFLASTTIISEKNSGTLKRNLLTPTSLSTFICGKIVSIILVGLAELIAILLIGVLAFNIYVPSFIPQLIAFIMLSLLSFSVIGMFIGIWSDSGMTAVLIAITLMIVLLFISGVLIPNELLPENVVIVGKYLPLSNIFSLLKSLFVYKITDWGALLYLLIISTLGTIACIISIKKQID
jgi:ABC-2 type transport system permease protein